MRDIASGEQRCRTRDATSRAPSYLPRLDRRCLLARLYVFERAIVRRGSPSPARPFRTLSSLSSTMATRIAARALLARPCALATRNGSLFLPASSRCMASASGDSVRSLSPRPLACSTRSCSSRRLACTTSMLRMARKWFPLQVTRCRYPTAMSAQVRPPSALAAFRNPHPHSRESSPRTELRWSFRRWAHGPVKVRVCSPSSLPT